jgi:hypothetical protein
MALVLKDRVKQTAAAPGTGTITLSGSVTGFQSFSAVGNGNSTYFAIYDPISGAWEVNYGTYTSSGTTLTRNATPLSSSNSGSLVNFTNAVDVFVTYPSENAVWRDTSGVVVQQSFGAITATSVALTSGTITAAPTNATDIVNKEYADSISSGLNYHQPANYASTAALPTYTYNNGASGIGATITAVANGALSLGGGSPTATQRVLVKDEIGGNAAYNGIYVVTQAGTSLLPFILTRATDYDSSGSGTNEIDQGDYVLVISGTLASTAWVQQTPLPITVGTTALTFLQFNAPITYYAGTGLTLSPATTFNIATTGVTAATYGSASSVPVITVNSQGQATVITNTAIAINGSAVSGNISGSAGSVANALTLGTYLTGTSYNGSAAVTATVDATATNTASKVVARDASGNFSAGTITATLNGAATSATTATNIAGGAANQIPYQTGAATTSFVTAPTVAGTYLNWSGSALAWSAISLPNNATFNNGGTGDASGTTFNGSAARTISYNTVGASPLAGSSSLTTTGTVTSGTWSASFGAVSGANLTSLTAGNLSGTIPSAVLGNSTAYVGTTAVALNRASGNLALTGILSETYVGATSGTTQVIPNAVAGTGTVLTLPNTTGTLALTSDLPTVNNATLTMNTSGTGLSGSQTFTANQATGATFTVASNATSANTISTIVARDASGNFSAGTITATLTGQASSVANSLTAGTYLSGTAYNGSAAQTWTVDATSANTASKVVARDASGNFSAGTITAALTGNLNGGTLNGPLYTATYDNSSKVMFNSASTYYLGLTGNVSTGGGSLSMVQYSNPDGTAAHAVNSYPLLHSNNYNSYAPTLTGTGASGTWSINVTGSAGSATTATTANALNTANNYQVNSLGIGTSSTTAGQLKATTAIITPGTTGVSSGFNVVNGDITTYRSGGTTGVVYLDNSGSKYLYYDGTNYNLANGNVVANNINAAGNVSGSSASCTGNAATATSSPLVSAVSQYSWSASTLPTSYSLGIQSSFVQGSQGWQSYGSVMTMNTYSGGGGALQMYVPYSPTYGGTGMQIRFGNYDVSSGNSWTSWKTILASDNYSSYALPITGGALTTSASNNLYIGRDLGATNYNAISMNGNTSDSGNMGLTGGGSGDSTLYINSPGNIVLRTSSFTYSNTISSFAQFAGSTRSPIFYDSGNTGYYAYPSSTSNFVGLTVANTISGSISGNAANVTGTVAVGNGGTGQTTGYKLFEATFTSSINANTDRTAGMYGSYASSATNTPTTSGILYHFLSGTGGAGDGGQFWQDYVTNNLYLRQRWGGSYGSWLTILSASNYTSYAMPSGSSATNSVDVRAPIFYDSNNTGYYVDPASTSALNGLTVAGNITASNGNGRIILGGNLHIDAFNGNDIFVNYYTTSNFRAFATGYSEAFRSASDGIVYAYIQFRTPIFYDYNNTGYYVDPASTSRMNTVNADSLYSYGNVTAYSDERLKKDWEELPTNFVEELAKVKSGTYTRIDSGERQVGVGAQSLQAILKEAVSEKEEYLGVHYGNAAMVSAVELAKEVVDLRARVAQLESLVNKLIGD